MASVERALRGSLPGVHQAVLNLKLGLDMASVLREVLRGNHEVIYLREIIDFETAELSMRAVLSDARLVLTTLHTLHAASVVSRLEDMGFERSRIARSLLFVQAQRQVHRLCLQCRRAIQVDPSVLVSAGLPPQHPQPEVLKTLRRTGLERVCEGLASLDEVLLETPPDAS